MEFDPMFEVPTTDEQAREAIYYGKNVDLANPGWGYTKFTVSVTECQCCKRMRKYCYCLLGGQKNPTASHPREQSRRRNCTKSAFCCGAVWGRIVCQRRGPIWR